MPTKVVDTILPTTMIGSYPKPRWYTRYNLAGAEIGSSSQSQLAVA